MKTDNASHPAMPKLCAACGHAMDEEIRPVDGCNGRFTVFSNDFREVPASIPPGSVAAVISDPPYGSGGFSVADRKKSSKAKYVSSNASYQKMLPDIDGDSLHPKAGKN